jgi:carbon monoxide dehydrogenase subunit G
MASVKVSERVDAGADAVWDLLRDFGGVTRYSPAIESCKVDGEGVGAVRTLAMPGGVSLQERLEALDDARRRLQYSIVAGPLPFENYLSTIEVREEGEGCTVDWSSTFDPKGVAEEQAQGMIEGIYRSGIAGIKKALG